MIEGANGGRRQNDALAASIFRARSRAARELPVGFLNFSIRLKVFGTPDEVCAEPFQMLLVCSLHSRDAGDQLKSLLLECHKLFNTTPLELGIRLEGVQFLFRLDNSGDDRVLRFDDGSEFGQVFRLEEQRLCLRENMELL